MVDRRTDLSSHGQDSQPASDILSSMGIVIKKIQREERPHCKILPEEVRQAPSVLHSQPRNVGLAPLPTFEDLRSRKQQASPKGN